MRYAILLVWLLVLSSCSTRLAVTHKLSAAEEKFQDHTGFMLYDLATRKTLVSYHSDKYFTPASNTKILTLFTALQILPDSVPALKYVIRHDTLVFWGSGDPSFLYKHAVNNGRVFAFLKNSPQKLFMASSYFQTDPFGPGWAWDDYLYAYSTERSPFPIYGNCATVRGTRDRVTVSPLLFAKHLLTADSANEESKAVRDIDSNQITFFPGRKKSARDSWEIPIRYSTDVAAEMLSDTLQKEVEEIDLPLPAHPQTFYSVPADSLYAVMMQASDNFIAEQLLLMCAGVLSDTLKPEIAIQYARKNFLFDLPDAPVWVDGSGLSRYNLITPRSIVRLWEKIYATVPKERLFKLLAAGGQRGTLKNSFGADRPFIFGKTGSLSNHHALSGYLISKKGRVLIFSFMNGDFVVPARDVRAMMQGILSFVRDKY